MDSTCSRCGRTATPCYDNRIALPGYVVTLDKHTGEEHKYSSGSFVVKFCEECQQKLLRFVEHE